MPSNAATTPFRDLFEKMRRIQGDVPQWNLVLRGLLNHMFLAQQARNFTYQEEVFIDRLGPPNRPATLPEKKAVREMFSLCHEQSGGMLNIGENSYWLLGWEWPNQGNHRGRRADLVALNPSGGLVVFECKWVNPDTPFTAALEGLDYLSCLTSASNFRKIVPEFNRWKADRPCIPDAFQNCKPNRKTRHEVIVLAPSEYYGMHSRSRRGEGWKTFASVGFSKTDAVSIRFAVSEFDCCQAKWAVGEAT